MGFVPLDEPATRASVMLDSSVDRSAQLSARQWIGEPVVRARPILLLSMMVWCCLAALWSPRARFQLLHLVLPASFAAALNEWFWAHLAHWHAFPLYNADRTMRGGERLLSYANPKVCVVFHLVFARPLMLSCVLQQAMAGRTVVYTDFMRDGNPIPVHPKVRLLIACRTAQLRLLSDLSLLSGCGVPEQGRSPAPLCWAQAARRQPHRDLGAQLQLHSPSRLTILV